MEAKPRACSPVWAARRGRRNFQSSVASRLRVLAVLRGRRKRRQRTRAGTIRPLHANSQFLTLRSSAKFHALRHTPRRERWDWNVDQKANREGMNLRPVRAAMAAGRPLARNHAGAAREPENSRAPNNSSAPYPLSLVHTAGRPPAGGRVTLYLTAAAARPSPANKIAGLVPPGHDRCRSPSDRWPSRDIPTSELSLRTIHNGGQTSQLDRRPWATMFACLSTTTKVLMSATSNRARPKISSTRI